MYSYKASWVKPSFVIVDIRALWLNPVWHRMLYSCAYMATVGVKGLSKRFHVFVAVVINTLLLMLL